MACWALCIDSMCLRLRAEWMKISLQGDELFISVGFSAEAPAEPPEESEAHHAHHRRHSSGGGGGQRGQRVGRQLDGDDDDDGGQPAAVLTALARPPLGAASQYQDGAALHDG